jgi:hypothetical protein
MQIGDRKFTAGLGTHANSELVYVLEPGFERFEAWVGVDAAMRQHPEGSVVFKVLTDGREVFDSGVMHVDSPAQRVSVAVKGVVELKLVVSDAADGINADHADWAEAVLVAGARLRPSAGRAKPAKFKVTSPAITVRLTEDGAIAGMKAGRFEQTVRALTELSGMHATGKTQTRKLAGGGLAFTRKLADARGHDCTVTDSFKPTPNSIRWELEISGAGDPWTTHISTTLSYPATTNSRVWTAWGAPDPAQKGWQDPLALQPLADRTWPYQFPGYWDFGAACRCICMPLATLAEPQADAAFSLVLSPEDDLLELWLKLRQRGEISFRRVNHRLGGGRTVRFAMDLVPHRADWRGGLGWLTRRYPAFFDPPNPRADALAGCAAYSGSEQPFDADKLRRMAFRLNWKCSEDFPYMGLFLPPLTDADARWDRAPDEQTAGKPAWTSFRTLNNYSRMMRTNGFHVLNYFNVTEYGRNMQFPPPAQPAAAGPDRWRDPHDYLFRGGRASAVLLDGAQPRRSNCYGALIVDPGDPAYQEHLLEQARRHLQWLPDSDGLAIDRLDWLNGYNFLADDGVSWIKGRPARSQFLAWRSLADKLGPLLHAAGKVLFINDCSARIELLRHVDGIYAEWTSAGLEPYFNYSALLGVRKPVMVWTGGEDDLKGPGADAYLQRCLHLGVYPTAPYPLNNHCLRPSPWVDEQYLAYGPLLDAMRGKKWVLTAHCVEALTPGVKVNLFQVPGGYALPVTFGGQAGSATVRLRNVGGLDQFRCAALQPGVDTPVPVRAKFKAGELELQVPLKRGCAMVRLAQLSKP